MNPESPTDLYRVHIVMRVERDMIQILHIIGNGRRNELPIGSGVGAYTPGLTDPRPPFKNVASPPDA
jgi:hypothetical protein